ncbi:MCE family protein [Hoyosella rhizosphaerae]|uniref:Mce family protein n=1 Tax=Hoyosella rhizosphaerae TaxID=1755582 RepID=A0A916ULD9_9ACTN|nr:MlaD family protein [Hoyosella rhizosphaerae]MBN4925482.1 MCE family protein [Hoyosella rhizosphaerae]GGC77368.1 putative Mce family protein [Hoyosella rhizosphaerae]
MIRWIKNLNQQLVGSGISKVYVTRPGLIGAIALIVLASALAIAAFFPTVIYNIRTAGYSVVLSSAGGISAGDPVYVAGVPAGRVESLEIEGDQVVAEFRVDRSRSLGDQTEAEVKLRTILGAYYLDVRPRGDGSLADGRIPLERSGVPFHFDEIARSAYDVTRTDDPDREMIDYEQLSDLADIAYQSIPDRELVDEAVTALADAAGIINNNGDQIEEILVLGRDLAEIIDRQQDTLTVLFDQGAVVFGTLGARAQLISGLINDLETVSARMTELLTAEPGEWDRLLISLRDVTTMLAAESDAIEQSLIEVGPAFRTLTDATGTGPWLDVSGPVAVLPDNMLCLLGAVEGCR